MVKVPKSLEAPHVAKDKRFYKRFNFESVAMEEYEIRLLYGRKVLSKLVIGGWSINILKSSEYEEKISFLFEATVINIGDTTEKDYKLNIYFNNFNKSFEASWDSNKSNYDYTWMDDKRVKISAVGKSPIFPNEKINGIRFKFHVPTNEIESALKEVKIEVALFYSNGEDKMEDDLSGLVDKVKEFNASKPLRG